MTTGQRLAAGRPGQPAGLAGGTLVQTGPLDSSCQPHDLPLGHLGGALGLGAGADAPSPALPCARLGSLAEGPR